MIWQFGELGYDYSIDFNGRLGEKPVRWDYFEDWQRSYNYRFLSSLIKLTTEHDVFETEEFFLNVSGAMKSIRLDHSSMNVFIAGNFDVQAGEIVCDFAHTGDWYEYFTGETLQVSDVNMQLNLAAGDYRLYTDIQLETPDIGTSINEGNNIKGASMHIFPNPVLTEAKLIFEVEESTEISIGVFDMLGREVINLGEKYYHEGVQEVEINMNGLESGLYFVILNSEIISDTVKLVKQ
jgi:hypothetical protein